MLRWPVGLTSGENGNTLVNSKLGLVGLVLVSAASLPFMAAGCLGGGESTETVDLGTPAPGQQAMQEMVIHFQPKLRKAKVYRVLPSAKGKAGPGISPLAETDVNLCNDGTTGSNNPVTCGYAAGTQTVELVTDSASVVDTYGTAASGSCPANSFCADVTMNSFWNKALNNTYVQITAITNSSGTALSGHSGTNSDATFGGLSNSLGLWQYQSSTFDTTHSTIGVTGVMGSGTANGATRTWVFANPDDADTYVRIKVFATTTYSSYSVGTPFVYNAIDACSGSTPANSNSTFTKTLPFSFTYWGTTTTTINYNKWGMASFGSSTGATILDGTVSSNQTKLDANQALPSTLAQAPHPAAFIFWDQLRWASSGTAGLCYKTLGTAPNRQAAITWKNVGFAGTGPFQTFTMVINEGSEEIWFNYDSMSGTSPNGGATMGGQNEAGTIKATGSTSASLTFASGTMRTLLPSP